MSAEPSFTVATYNVLADAYVRPAYYPHTPPAALEPARRRRGLLRRIEALGADVLCLQEVEPPLFSALLDTLGPRGYRGGYARKGRKPDGVAVLVRGDALEALETIPFADGGAAGPDSGHLALVATIGVARRRAAVACTHLLWDAPGTPVAQQRGLQQMAQLLQALESPGRPEARIVCGDLNATIDGEALRLALGRGLREGGPAGPTCNANRRRQRIDHLLHTAALSAEALPLSPIGDETPLPSLEEPSDHLAAAARFWWPATASA